MRGRWLTLIEYDPEAKKEIGEQYAVSYHLRVPAARGLIDFEETDDVAAYL